MTTQPFAEQPQRVAVTVFCTVPEGEDDKAAVIAVRQALTGHAMRLPITVHATFASGSVPVTVAAVEETGTAAANGCLWITPTNRAYPQRSND